MKKIFLYLLSTLFLVACGNDDDPKPLPEKEASPITVWAYLIADNSLTNVLSDNIEAMCKNLSEMDTKATLLVYWDGGKKNENLPNPCILKLATDGYGKINDVPARDSLFSIHKIATQIAEVVKEYPQQLSTSIEVMQMVMNDMAMVTPTEEVALIAGSHANGWLEGTANSRAFGEDNDYTMSVEDMANVMSKVGKTFDVLLFDACLMGNAEVCYAFKDVVNYQIVSPMEIPAYGFPYDSMLDDLFMGNVNGYKDACQEYISYYTKCYLDGESNVWGTISLINSEKMDDLAQAVHQELTEHKDIIGSFNPKLLQEFGRQSTYRYLSFDLNQFMKEINDGSVPSSFTSTLNEVVLYTGCLEDARPTSHEIDIKNYCGLGLYIPIQNKTSWNRHFKTIDWYTAAGWENITFSWE